MNLQIFRCKPSDEDSETPELDIEQLSWDEPRWENLKATGGHIANMKAKLYATIAETVRSKLQLTTTQREGIQQWLHSACVGDTLLVSDTLLGSRDDIAIVMCERDHIPVYSRLEVKKIEKVEIRVLTLPANTKKPASKSKKRKKTLKYLHEEDDDE